MENVETQPSNEHLKPSLNVEDVSTLLAGADGLSFAGTLLDVRGYDEFAGGHASGAICIPLPELEKRVGEIDGSKPVFVMCQSGGRSAIAAGRLRSLGMRNVVDVQGGYDSWRRADLPVVVVKTGISLERQVRISSGVMVLLFCILGFTVNKRFFLGATLIGCLQIGTGALGICPMITVLQKLPWN